MESTFVMVQMHSTPDPAANLKKAQELAAKAVEKFRPDLLLYPETFMSEPDRRGGTVATEDTVQSLEGTFARGMRNLAAKYKVWIVFGMQEKNPDPGDSRCFNSVVMVNSQGEIVQVYHKTHLYDAFGGKESDLFKAGDKFFEPVETPFGKIGVFVCYEVRFPEVARYQRAHGADILLMPTAWVKGDLKSLHYRTLVTARAIENTVYLLACNQCGGIRLGESMAVDPMGVTIAAAGESDALVPVYLDSKRIEEVRGKLPSYEDRRPDLYK